MCGDEFGYFVVCQLNKYGMHKSAAICAQYTRKQTSQREMKFWNNVIWCALCVVRWTEIAMSIAVSVDWLINYRLLLLFNCLRIQSISVLWHIHYYPMKRTVFSHRSVGRRYDASLGESNRTMEWKRENWADWIWRICSFRKTLSIKYLMDSKIEYAAKPNTHWGWECADCGVKWMAFA